MNQLMLQLGISLSREYVFGVTPGPAEAAAMGQAWMRMLTLQLGILLKPYLASPAASAVA